MHVLTLRLAALLAACAGPAAAHVSLQPATATAGAYQVLRFGVGHGCGSQATTAVRIEIPPGVATARPQPKPGWTLQVERRRDQTGEVSAVTWRGGPLPADQFEELVMLVKLPPAAGRLAFPAVQACGRAEVRWTEIVPAGGPRPTHPAPTLTVSPATSSPPTHNDHSH